MILCCGEALIDMIPASTETGGNGFVPHSGGAVFNTAIALGRLGVQTGLLSGISSDMFGQQLLNDLHTAHVSTSYVIRADRPTTLAFAQLTDGHASYSFYDENSAGRMLRPKDLPTLPEDITALYFGGISLACEPGARAYAALAGREHASRTVMLDPNIRPGLVQKVDQYRNRLDRIMAHADIIKVSDEDLNWLYSDLGSPADKIARIRAAGPSVVILTRGGAGATAWLADGTKTSVPGRKVAVADTVGAGDTFNAGVLAYLSERDLLSKSALASITPDAIKGALSFGAAVAAITVSRSGANSPWRWEV